MKLTVGPHPPAVYWRRRAVVIGALLLVAFVLYSCAGLNGDGSASPGASNTPSPQSTFDPNAPGVEVTPTVLTPEAGAPAEESYPPEDPPTESDGEPVPLPGESDFPTAEVTAAPADGTCSDEEIGITPVPSKSSVPAGSTVVLRLKITNASNRTCNRDVGSGPQELYVKQGATVVWSSDTCSTAKAANVQAFAAGLERQYQVSWNGRDSTKCNGVSAAGPVPKPGQYQLFGRLGLKVSAPVDLTLT